MNPTNKTRQDVELMIRTSVGDDQLDQLLVERIIEIRDKAYREGVEDAAKVLKQRTELWARRWRDNIRPDCKDEASHRLSATLALGEDAGNCIAALLSAGLDEEGKR